MNLIMMMIYHYFDQTVEKVILNKRGLDMSRRLMMMMDDDDDG